MTLKFYRQKASNTDNEDDARRIAKLASMPDKSRAVKEWLDYLIYMGVDENG